MKTYIIKRLIQAVGVCLVISMISFFLLFLNTGLARSKEVHDMCRQADIGVWCGGMFETGVGRAVQVALAGLPNFIYPNDISASARYYPRDIVDPEFALNPDGTISVRQAPGLGVEVNQKIIDSYTTAREVIRV